MKPRNRIASPVLILGGIWSTCAAFTGVDRPKVFFSSSCTQRGVGNKGFGESDKTYGKTATTPIQEIIDAEAAMSEFFSSNQEWHPLFQTFCDGAGVAAGFLATSREFDFDCTRSPWKRRNGIPTDESERQVLAQVLDSMHASLIGIPVDEATNEDDNDVQFLEEGRRILAISRFHVLPGVTGGSVQSHDQLFSTCWSELMELREKDQVGTGSLIVVPDYEISDLRRFTDMNLLRPLEWLGVQADFEVTSFERGSPAIRVLHKLQDMPEGPPLEDPSDEI